MTDVAKLMLEYAKNAKDLEDLVAKGTAQLELGRAEFRLAFLSEDPKQLEDARSKCVDIYTANLDQICVLMRKMWDLRKKVDTL